MVDMEYRVLTPADEEQAAEVISQAFVQDPLCRFMLPFEKTRQKTLKKFFRIYGELNILQSRGYGCGTPLEGVAYWISPGKSGVSISLRLLPRFLPVLFTLYPLGLLRGRKIVQTIDELHAKYTPGPHYYLDNIGVLESALGKGIASKMIRPVLEKAAAENVVAYTDTVTESNVAMYEHLGFELMEAKGVKGTGITVWALRTPVK